MYAWLPCRDDQTEAYAFDPDRSIYEDRGPMTNIKDQIRAGDTLFAMHQLTPEMRFSGSGAPLRPCAGNVVYFQKRKSDQPHVITLTIMNFGGPANEMMPAEHCT